MLRISWQMRENLVCQLSGRDRKMTITPTQLGSTSILDNHKLQDFDKNVEDDQDAPCSPYTPSLEMTRGHNSRTRTNCGAPLYDAFPIHPQLASLPPLYPDSPLFGETPLLPLQLPRSPGRTTLLSQRSCPHLLIPL